MKQIVCKTKCINAIAKVLDGQLSIKKSF